MTWMLAQVKVDFPLLYAEWRIWTYENAIVCKQKCKNRYYFLNVLQSDNNRKKIKFLGKNIFWALLKAHFNPRLSARVKMSLMNASSRYWSSIHANECVFSRNEQQKV